MFVTTPFRTPFGRLRQIALLALPVLLTLLLHQRQAAVAGPAPQGLIPTSWSVDLPLSSVNCPGWSIPNCNYSSPTLADLNGDGRLDVVAGTDKGFVVAVRHDGAPIFSVDVAPFFGMTPGTQQIASSPAVADLDGDGAPEIIVGVGTTEQAICTQGAVVVLSNTGQLRPGWPQLGDDYSIPPGGCRDSFFATPAVGDLDNDGLQEIVAGGFDKRIYAWRHDGTLLAGFPPSSNHSQRFPTWPNLVGRLTDTIWGSAALSDIDGDSYLDIIIPTDEGDFDARYGPSGYPWTCPYRLPGWWTPGYCGGSLYVLNRFGNPLPGWPRYIAEVMFSSPTVIDLTGDGSPEIIMGAGDFYHRISPDRPTHGFRILVWDAQGNDVPGFEGGLITNGPTPASPAVGDLTGDGRPEIVALTTTGFLYAWSATGELLPGFPMSPRDHYNNGATFNVGTNPILGDFTGDGKMEIFVNVGWTVTIVDGQGQQITSNSFPNPKPIYDSGGLLLNNPTLGDLNGDGRIDLVAANSQIHAWYLGSSGSEADWPMWRLNPSRTGSVYAGPPPTIDTGGISELDFLLDVANIGEPITGTLVLDVPRVASFAWAITAPPQVAMSATAGASTDREVITFAIDTTNLTMGINELGSLDIQIDAMPLAGGPPIPLSVSLPVVIEVAEIHYVYLPLAIR